MPDEEEKLFLSLVGGSPEYLLIEFFQEWESFKVWDKYYKGYFKQPLDFVQAHCLRIFPESTHEIIQKHFDHAAFGNQLFKQEFKFFKGHVFALNPERIENRV